jgi:ubiquinone/menaquinone biosynthesis C-methylase UbiE
VTQTPEERYAAMQQEAYERMASQWHPELNRDPVVGSFDAHNTWPDYEQYLFQGLPDTKRAFALDFGCGPGRNLVRFAKLFYQIDGADISEQNLINAQRWLVRHREVLPAARGGCRLYQCNGRDLQAIPDDSYHVVFSTITLQHICMHSIRFGYFREFLRVLEPGGWFTAQMGYGYGTPRQSVGYYENYYTATDTNGACDTRVEDPSQLSQDLLAVGFTNFQYWIRPTGPGDTHPNWIFFRAQRPQE